MADLKINSAKFGIAGGILGALLSFFTTITGILGYSEAYQFLLASIWSSLGYSLSWTGAFIGAIIGFVYGFILMKIFALIYNKLISK